MSKPSSKSKADKVTKPLTKTTGRATVKPPAVSPTSRHTPIEMKTQVNRGIGSGAGTKRGDRKDTHPSFSTGKVSRDGGRAGPLGKSTRKGGPKTRKEGE